MTRIYNPSLAHHPMASSSSSSSSSSDEESFVLPSASSLTASSSSGRVLQRGRALRRKSTGRETRLSSWHSPPAASSSLSASSPAPLSASGVRGTMKKRRKRIKRQRQRRGIFYFSFYTIGLFLFFIGCAIAGVFVGVLLTSPFVIVDTSQSFLLVSSDVDRHSNNNPISSPSDNTVTVVRDATSSSRRPQVQLHGTFFVSLVNHSFFTLQYSINDFDFYYYPTGTNPSCLFHSGGLLTSSSSSGGNAAEYRRLLAEDYTVGQTSTQEDKAVPTSPFLSDPTNSGSASSSTAARASLVSFPPAPDEPYLTVTVVLNKVFSTAADVKLIAFDCHSYQNVMISLVIKKNLSIGPFSHVSIDAFYELIAAWKCSISDAAFNEIMGMPGDSASIFFSTSPLFQP